MTYCTSFSRSAYKYFVTTYKGSETAAQVWKSLSNKEKQKYDDELMQKKRQYIMDFEKFLNSLSKTELEEYSKLRKEAAKQKSEEEEDEDEEEEDEESEVRMSIVIFTTIQCIFVFLMFRNQLVVTQNRNKSAINFCTCII